MRFIYKFLIAFFLVFSSYVNANSICSDNLKTILVGSQSQDQALESLENIEKQLSNAYNEIANSLASSGKALDSDDTNLLSGFSTKLENTQDRALNDEKISSLEIKTLIDELNAIQESVIAKSIRENQPLLKVSWANILEDPSLIVAEKVYSIKLIDGGVMRVKFKDKVVQNIFSSNDKSRQLFSKRALPQLQKGIMGGGTIGSGLKRLKINKSIIELAVTGKDAGRIRLGGYLEGDTLYMVHWSNDNDHSSTSYIVRFRDSVLSAMN